MIVVAVAASALAGCNANQAINPSGQADLSNIYPDYNSYNPDSYAPNHTGWVARLQVHVSGALSELGFRHADNVAELRTDATPTMRNAAAYSLDGANTWSRGLKTRARRSKLTSVDASDEE